MDSSLNELRVPLEWTSPEGVQVTKTLIFRRGSYRIDVEYDVKNGSAAPWSRRRLCADPARPCRRSSARTSTSTAIRSPARRYYDGTKYKKLKITNKEDAGLNRDVTSGWMASLQHHFVAAVVPAREEAHRYLAARAWR